MKVRFLDTARPDQNKAPGRCGETRTAPPSYTHTVDFVGTSGAAVFNQRSVDAESNSITVLQSSNR
jgi:hypothetical protein